MVIAPWKRAPDRIQVEDLRTTFKAISLAPDVDKDLANEVLGSAGVGDQSDDEVVKAYIVAGVQDPHSGLVASCDCLY